jgi:PhnB protein
MNRTTEKNQTIVQPYLIFGGKCEEAIKFYHDAVGAEVEMMMRFKECPDPCGCPPDWADKVMHCSLRVGETVIMASDGCWEERASGFAGFSLSLSVPDEAEAARRFQALSKGGKVIMPMEKTFFAKTFGMVADKYGVSWMVIVPAEMPATSTKLESALA